MVEQLSNIKRDNLKGKEDKMGDMSWLSHLVTTGSRKELEDFLKDKGFRKPRYAAEQFLKAQAEIEEDGMRKKEKEVTVQDAIDNMDEEPIKVNKKNNETCSKCGKRNTYFNGDSNECHDCGIEYEPTTADEFNKEWLNEEKAES